MELTNRNFSDNDVIHWRDLLERRKKIVLATEKNLRKKALTELSTEETGETSKTRLHPADLATNTQEIETLETLSENNIKIAQEIDQALERLDKGMFGTCENCNQPISNARLELIPEARYCLGCDEEIEKMQQQINPEKDLRQTSFSAKMTEALGDLLVSDIMQENPITVHADESLDTARALLLENNFRHLPVVDSKGDIQGIVSDRDLLSMVIGIPPGKLVERTENAWSKNRVRHVMTKTPETVNPDTNLLEAGSMLLENKISCLPVVEGNRLVGIITDSDFVKLVSGVSSANA